MMQVKETNLISLKSVKKILNLMHTVYKYKNILSIRGFFTKCFNDLITEIDDAMQEYVAQNSDRILEKVDWNFKDDEAISSEEIEIVTELLTLNRKERRKFLGFFPIWKDNRLETIKYLREIAEELQKVDERANRLNLVASVSGLSAGIINIAKAVKEYVPVPECMQKAAPVLSAVNGLIRSYTSTSRELNLERLSKKAEKTIQNDIRHFQRLMSWFDYNKQLMHSVKSAIGSQLYELIFIKLRTFFDKIKSSDEPSVENLRILFSKIVEFLIQEGCCISLAVPLAAVSLKLFLALSSTLLSLEWPDAALPVSRIASIGKTAVYGARTALAAHELLNTSNSETSCVGIILDIGPAVLDFKRLVAGDATNEQVENINKIANTLEDGIRKIEQVYVSLSSE